MTTHFTTGMFDYLSGNLQHLSTVTPCLLSDESFFQKTLLGIHKLRLNVKDKVQIDIRIQREEQEALPSNNHKPKNQIPHCRPDPLRGAAR